MHDVDLLLNENEDCYNVTKGILDSMQFIIVVVPTLLWLTGLLTSHTWGGSIDLLMIVPIVVLLFRDSRGQQAFGAKKPGRSIVIREPKVKI